MSKKNFFSNILNQISGIFRDITKYSLSRMSPFDNTSKNDKFTNCRFSLNSAINLMPEVIIDSDNSAIIIHYPKPKLRNLLQNAFYFLISMNFKTIFLMK
jgi:hypothetical protein